MSLREFLGFGYLQSQRATWERTEVSYRLPMVCFQHSLFAIPYFPHRILQCLFFFSFILKIGGV